MATASRTQWYAIALLFFFNVDSGAVVLQTTELLSQKTYDDSFTGTPSILNLYQNPRLASVTIFKAVNSEPKVLVSTEFCLFENQFIGAMLKNVI